MDISALSVVMSMDQLRTNVGFAVMAKAMDTMEEGGEAITEMLEGSINPDLGQNIDIRV